MNKEEKNSDITDLSGDIIDIPTENAVKPKKSRNYPSRNLNPFTGHTKILLDPKKVEEMAASFLPVDQIARILDISVDTLYLRYSEPLHKGQANRKHELACAMWHKALVERDTKMMIWLSKQHLGYRDNTFDDASGVQFNITINEIPK